METKTVVYPVAVVKNDEEAFKAIAKHLIQQGERSTVNNGVEDTCMYRGRFEFGEDYDLPPSDNELNGKACAVGCLIADDHYESFFEGYNACDEVVIRTLQNSHPDWIITDESVMMLRNMQMIHDNLDPKAWPTLLRFIRLDDVNKFSMNDELHTDLIRAMINMTNELAKQVCDHND